MGHDTLGFASRLQCFPSLKLDNDNDDDDDDDHVNDFYYTDNLK